MSVVWQIYFTSLVLEDFLVLGLTCVNVDLGPVKKVSKLMSPQVWKVKCVFRLCLKVVTGATDGIGKSFAKSVKQLNEL